MNEKFTVKPNPTKVSEVLFNVMQVTKKRMVSHYENKDADGIRIECRNFRTFSRLLFIRGDYCRCRQLSTYVNTEMEKFKDMLLENERWWG